MAVLLIASAPPSATAPCQPTPQRSPQDAPASATVQTISPCAATAPSIVSATWLRPRPKTSLRMLLSLGRLNSSPMTNIRKTTPNSAR